MNLNLHPERLKYVTRLKLALKKAADVNMYARMSGRSGFGRRLDLTKAVIAFHESMCAENAEPEFAACNFIYIKFTVSIFYPSLSGSILGDKLSSDSGVITF